MLTPVNQTSATDGTWFHKENSDEVSSCASRRVPFVRSNDPINPEYLSATPAGRWLKAHGAEELTYAQVVDFIQRLEELPKAEIMNLLAREVFVVLEDESRTPGFLFCALRDASWSLGDQIYKAHKALVDPLDAALLRETQEPFPYPCYVRPNPDAEAYIKTFVAKHDPRNRSKLKELLAILNENGIQSKEFSTAWYPYRDSLKKRTSTSSSCCSVVALASLSAVAAASLAYMWRQ